MAKGKQQAYCTLLLSDEYLPGALVLAHSLRDNGTKKQLAVLVTMDSLQVSTIDELKIIYDHIIPVDRIINKRPASLHLMDRLDLISTFTKIALWRQIQFEHIVYLDADVVALRAPDELFDLDHTFAGVPDIGWPDCFNSGVLSLKPNMGDYYALLALAQRGISFDGADQGLLNMYFRDWHRLSFTYNCTPSGNYQYVPAYRHFESSIKLIHYIGNSKPWILGRDKGSSTVVYEELLGRWWAVYDRHYKAATNSYEHRPSKQSSTTVQSFVEGETSSADYEYSARTSEGGHREPEIHSTATEKPLTENTELVDDIQMGDVKPTSTVEQRRYSAVWDPIRHPPPEYSRPEAPNFPSQIYNMSKDANLFQAPKAYLEPPKNLNYQVPTIPPSDELPKPIFPWEEKQARATRVFPDDIPNSPPKRSPPVVTPISTTTETKQAETTSSPAPSIVVSSPPPFASYSRTNAWDDIAGIERYIQNLPQNQRRRAQALKNSSFTAESPGTEGPSQKERRPSMKVTDFPTEIERPSLPVTPAPIRRPSFWGEERNAAGELPGAEGVPEQSDWDPATRLADLQRRQSEVLAQGPSSTIRAIPDRELLGSMPPAAIPEESTIVPTFGQLDFSGVKKRGSGDDEIMPSPIESAG